MTRLRHGGLVGLVAASVLVLSACAQGPGQAAVPTTEGGSGVPSSPVSTPDVSDAPTEAAEPTCETIISETIVADFKSLGWSVKEEPFYLGETPLNGGIQCTWGDLSVASDHVQVFGWAPVTDEQAAAAREELLASGWRQVDENGRTYITENASTTVAPDEDGYGLTYLFGDGWVEIADTKQGLLLVEWPPQ